MIMRSVLPHFIALRQATLASVCVLLFGLLVLHPTRSNGHFSQKPEVAYDIRLINWPFENSFSVTFDTSGNIYGLERFPGQTQNRITKELNSNKCMQSYISFVSGLLNSQSTFRNTLESYASKAVTANSPTLKQLSKLRLLLEFTISNTLTLEIALTGTKADGGHIFISSMTAQPNSSLDGACIFPSVEAMLKFLGTLPPISNKQ